MIVPIIIIISLAYTVVIFHTLYCYQKSRTENSEISDQELRSRIENLRVKLEPKGEA